MSSSGPTRLVGLSPRIAAGHDVRFYDHASFPAALVAEYVASALGEGGTALVLTTLAHRTAIARELRTREVDSDALAREGRFVALDAEATLLALDDDGALDESAFDQLVGHTVRTLIGKGGELRVFGDAVDVLTRRRRNGDALKLETLWNRLRQKNAFSLLCTYACDGFESADAVERFSAICAEHSGVALHEPGVTTTLDPGRLIAHLHQRTRALEREVEKSQKLAAELAEAVRTKDAFLAMLGHELRNPLSPMLTALQLMRLRHGDVAVKERMVLERQVAHMGRLIDDLLDVARIRRGYIELTRRPLELAQVVATAVEIATPLLESRAHRLSTRVPERGLVVDVDPQRMAQVISNLLTNAARYTPPGGAVELSAETSAGRVALRVKDDGIGIEPGMLASIFSIFVQGRQAIDRPHGGLGLGLFVARQLVELHGGTIRAESDGPGHGSTFVVELPHALASRPSPSPAPGPVELSAGAGRRVLVVDDNEDAAGLLCDALWEAGYLARAAHDGPSALRVAEEWSPEIALLDIGLPVMDGYELARELRATLGPRAPKLVALTGYGQPGDRARAAEAGFAEHVIKPVDLARLSAVLRRHLG